MNEHRSSWLGLGAYLLGSLDPRERAEIDTHLPGCSICREELGRLAALPGLLGRLSAAEARTGALEPTADLLPRLLAAVAEERRSQRRRLGVWRAAAVASGIAAVAAGALTLAPAVAPGPAGTPVTVAAGVAVEGHGSLEARPWGTQVRLDVRGLPRAEGYTAYAVRRDGRREVAASWGATPGGRAKVDGATGIARAELERVEVVTSSGQPVLSLGAPA
ncbi:MAG: zf-HC2 domain-containing protein [Actinomycetota bacterium]|nr:zf-HC2 domain-containing protein [Actinomycetota bacterium]